MVHCCVVALLGMCCGTNGRAVGGESIVLRGARSQGAVVKHMEKIEKNHQMKWENVENVTLKI